MESTRMKLTEDNIKFLSTEKITKRWTLEEDSTWWYDLFNRSLKEKLDFDELVEKLNEDIKEGLSLDEICDKYEV